MNLLLILFLNQPDHGNHDPCPIEKVNEGNVDISLMKMINQKI